MKSKFVASVLTLVMCFSAAVGMSLAEPHVAQAEPALSQDADGYYLIANEDELFAFSALVNGGEVDANAKLTADITMTGESRPWTPIAMLNDTSKAYTGIFDGQGHIVSKLYFKDRSAPYGGLVGFLNGGTVKNVTISEGYVEAVRAGAVAGGAYGNSTIEGCGNLNTTLSGSNAGGIVSNVNGTVRACWNTGSVSGDSMVGGICGSLTGAVKGCWSMGDINSGSYAGGIVGLAQGKETVSYCYSDGIVKGGSDRTGAIVGGGNNTSTDPDVSNCRYIVRSGGALGAHGRKSDNIFDNVDRVWSSMLPTGEAAYLLNQGLSGTGYRFYQNLDNGSAVDAYPVLNSTHGTVYQGYRVCEEKVSYSNAPLPPSFFHTGITYEADGSTIREVCTNASCKTSKGLGSVTLKVSDAYFTGAPVAAVVEGDLLGGGSCKLTYNDGSANAPSSVGKHAVTMAVSEDGTQMASVTAEYEISYLPAPSLSEFGVSGHDYSDSGAYWFRGNAVAHIAPPEGYTVSTVLDGTYGDSVTLSGRVGENVYLKRTSDGAMTDAVDLSGMLRWDAVSPAGEIALSSGSTWKSLLNKISFGLFFKNAKTASIAASDAESGVKSVEYYVAEDDLIADAALSSQEAVEKLESAISADGGWVKYSASEPIELGLTSAYVLYAKITDNVGNVAYVSSDGIVLYEDAALAGSESATYDHEELPEFSFDSNGNTLESVKIDGVALSEGDYVISPSRGSLTTLMISKDRLDSLMAGEHVVTLSFDPLGHAFVEKDGNDQPAVLSMSLTVNPWRVEIPAADTKDFVYNGSEQTYAIAESDRYTVSGSKQTLAGDHTVTVSLNDKENTVWADGTTEDKTYEFHIAKADYDISAAKWGYDGAFTYDGTEHTVEIGGLPAGVTAAGYAGNAAVEPGDYEATVSLGYDEQNYNEPTMPSLSWSIESAWVPTEDVEKTGDVTPGNVKPEDKDDLEKAKESLEAALNDEAKNYSDETKAAIEEDLGRVNEALEVIVNVENVEDLIGKLPDAVTKSDEAAVKAADEAYNALTEYEKSLVSEDAKKALKDAKADLAEAEKAAIAGTGDASPVAVVFAVSLGAAVLLFASRRMMRAA